MEYVSGPFKSPGGRHRESFTESFLQGGGTEDHSPRALVMPALRVASRAPPTPSGQRRPAFGDRRGRRDEVATRTAIAAGAVGEVTPDARGWLVVVKRSPAWWCWPPCALLPPGTLRARPAYAGAVLRSARRPAAPSSAPRSTALLARDPLRATPVGCRPADGRCDRLGDRIARAGSDRRPVDPLGGDAAARRAVLAAGLPPSSSRPWSARTGSSSGPAAGCWPAAAWA